MSYAILSGLLTALFGITSAGAGLVLGRGSDLGIAVATLACALAFGPLRGRVQRVVEARFDRDHSDALARVARFVDAVRDGTAEPEQIEDTFRLAVRDPDLRISYAGFAPRRTGASRRPGADRARPERSRC
jgi:hypothetical protein